MEELRKMYPYMSWENMNHLQENVKTINSVLYENILASGIFSYMNTEQKAKLKERVRKIKKDEDETQIKNVQKTTPEPQVASTEGDSKMKDIQEVYRKRVFDELTPVQLDEILLGEIDELNPPIKIGSLEFKASEIIKQLRPDALENNDFLVALFESEEWYESMMHALDGGYCWLYPPTDENGEYLKYEGVNPEKDWSFFRWQGCHRIMRESKIYFLQEYKNILLQENQNDLLQEVKKELQHYLKHEDPVEIEIYSRTTSVRRFLNSNGEESFRAVEKPEPSVIPEPTKINNPTSNLISEEVITETFAALKAANIEEVTVSFSSDSDGCPPVDWIKFCFNKQGIEDLIKNKKSRKDTLIRENLDLDEPWHLEIYEYHFEEANIPNLKCTKELWNILVSFVYKEYETLDNKAGGYVIWRRNLVVLDACENVKLRNSDPWEQMSLFASGKYVRQYDKPNYTTMKTDELDGAALDFMVSYDEYLENVIPLRDENDEIWSPSTIWEQGGVYIHLNNISICYENENQWKSYISGENTSYGSTPLVSAMRCFVKSKFGVTVDIPNWVLGKELAKA